MNSGKIIEPIGYIIAAATLIFSLILFYSDTGQFLGSLGAAILAAGLVWVSYVITRMLWLALK